MGLDAETSGINLKNYTIEILKVGNYLAPEGHNIYFDATSSTKFIENIELMLTIDTNEALN